jgi:hypothetical protein
LLVRLRIASAKGFFGVISSHQFEEEIGAASAENGLFIAKMEFSVRTAVSSTIIMPLT